MIFDICKRYSHCSKNRVAIMDMMSTLNKFLDSNMEISVDKINMLAFNKKSKEKKEKWH